MTSLLFYQQVGECIRAEGPRNLVGRIISRMEGFDSLTSAITARLAANRARRTGKPVKLSARAKATIREAEQDAREAESKMRSSDSGFKTMTDVELVRMALGHERLALKDERFIFTSKHADDMAALQPLFAIREANIEDLVEALAFFPGATDPGEDLGYF
jgi:hypothetical protein